MQPVSQKDLDDISEMLGPETKEWLLEYHELFRDKLLGFPYSQERFEELRGANKAFCSEKVRRGPKGGPREAIEVIKPLKNRREHEAVPNINLPPPYRFQNR